MQRFSVLLLAGVLASPALGDTTVYVGDSSAAWLGFQNVSFLDGTPAFGSPWGVFDLRAEFDDGADKLTLKPTPIDTADDYWYQTGAFGAPAPPYGGPGAIGNKTMEANLYFEPGGLNGETVTFVGEVLSDTLSFDDPGDDPLTERTAQIFIKDFAPDYSSFESTIIDLVPGPFSISLDTINDPARHVQWGITWTGLNVWPSDIDNFGNIMIATPEPGTLVLLGLGGLMVLRRRA